MKVTLACLCIFLATASFALASDSSKTKTSSDTTGTVPNLPSSGDAGTELVVRFYKLLLQKKPPTLADEQGLFDEGDLKGIRPTLVAAGYGKTTDPVFLNYFRKHKNWFLPDKSILKGRPDGVKLLGFVEISSTLHWRRSLTQMKDPPKPGYGEIIALFPKKTAGTIEAPFHTVVFDFSEGKIDAGGISLGGFSGTLALEKWLQLQKKLGIGPVGAPYGHQ